MVLLQEKELEKVTVKELCDRCLIPKSTFYNYFENIYDLAVYSMDYYRKNILRSYDYKVVYEFEDMGDTFETFLLSHKQEIRKIMKHNPEGSAFYAIMQKYTSDGFVRIFEKFEKYRNKDYPIRVQANISASVFICILQWMVTQSDDFIRRELTRKFEASISMKL